MRELRVGLVLALLAVDPSVMAQEAWDPRFTNPVPMADDVVLPLPCGGAMAFRPVLTPAEAEPLADRAIQLGDTEPRTGYLEYLRQSYVLGPFGPDGGRYYLIGKHEVTRDQHAAVMRDACPKPQMGGRVPVTGISWYDAVAFTRRYGEWLYANARDRLPKAGNVPGYPRLPTEAEWEYAARGGAAVTDVQFRQRLFPMEGGLGRYAWFKGSQSANNRLNLVGAKEPNPLGLFDVLGNAEELILEPFQLNRVGRLHGEAGGVVARGGSYQDAPERLTTAMRREYPHLEPSSGKPTALGTMGFRVVLTAAVAGDLDRATTFQEAWTAASAARVGATEDAIVSLRRLGQETTEIDTRTRLEAIEAQVKAELARRNELEGRALRQSLRSATTSIRALLDVDANLAYSRKVLAVTAGLAANPSRQAQIEATRQAVASNEKKLDEIVDDYIETLYHIITTYDVDAESRQLAVLKSELEAKQRSNLLGPLDMLSQNIAWYRKRPGASRADLRQEILRR
jgi:hypothetical protein